MDLATALSQITGKEYDEAWGIVKAKAEAARGDDDKAKEADTWLKARKVRKDVKAIMTDLAAKRATAAAAESEESVDDLL